MRIKYLMLPVIALLTQTLYSQEKPQVIKATSIHVDIKDDNTLRKNAWNIVPEANPDVYATSAKKVTFYTDIDSISFNIIPDRQYDFVILLNGKDSARTRIVWEPSKLDILKKAEEYNYSDDRYVPAFTYLSPDNPDLARTRKELNLDSVAGAGSELSQIFNLLHWVHNTVRHDGSSKNPKSKNAVDLINVCKKENRGVNCRMMATILNECYLAMGIKSRYITCLPKDSEDPDCHVINMVYSSELKRWIWIDPTFDAYVMDDSGNLLGLREVRERLIKGEPLVLNADANWNRTNLQLKEHYLDYYMAKNLYKMQTPLASGYNTETWDKVSEVTYVELVPLDDAGQTPQKKEEMNKKTDTKFTYYKTNNPDVFWAKPE